ncbi:MAG TPA: hypothetical protein VNZ66_00025 [Aeromicrobium sp.]|nr:hypothetical protein [Aeromicrobium sp.]
MQITTSSPVALPRAASLAVASAGVVVLATTGGFGPATAGADVAVPPPSAASAASLDQHIRAQAALGRTCSAQAGLTDVVLFESATTHDIVVLTFNQAIAATAAWSGWVRSYCT